MMETQTTYIYLEHRPDKQTQERFIRGTGVRTSTIWHDRYIVRLTPQQIAQNRDLPEAALLEALAYCQDHWDADLRRKGRRARVACRAGLLCRGLLLPSDETLPR